ncbi:hypothetical protein J1N35_002866 [Gossypium stocksii]|uniref:C2H2-type domain-containing protein n=1 Tax=Gossypium stocksii TaxID=47602 RepID=A0A9D3WNK9_9ROSI|nr:hypothetical protein J1N35_002866 [Gossypium stocksii]
MDQYPKACRICDRRFSNGKALGAHMRFHFPNFSLPPCSSSSNPPLSSLTSTKHELSTDSTESSENPSGKRSKHLPKFSSDMAMNDSPSDSVSSPFSMEDAALCLLMLSRTERTDNPKLTQGYEISDHGVGFDYEKDEEDGEFFTAAKAHPKCYKCETCNRTFRSHQALGGHTASHNFKNKKIAPEEEAENGGDATDHKIHQQRIFECEFCDRVFQSGQALGGHKKIHFGYSPSVTHNRISIKFKPTAQPFDLNLPPSEQDDDKVSLAQNTVPQPSVYDKAI